MKTYIDQCQACGAAIPEGLQTGFNHAEAMILSSGGQRTQPGGTLGGVALRCGHCGAHVYVGASPAAVWEACLQHALAPCAVQIPFYLLPALGAHGGTAPLEALEQAGLLGPGTHLELGELKGLHLQALSMAPGLLPTDAGKARRFLRELARACPRVALARGKTQRPLLPLA